MDIDADAEMLFLENEKRCQENEKTRRATFHQLLRSCSTNYLAFRMASPEGTALLVMKNLHRFIQSTELMQAFERQLIEGEQNRTILVGLSPTAQIPTELEKMFVVIDHALPDRDQLKEIAEGIATEESELPSGVELERILDAVGGLTRSEA